MNELEEALSLKSDPTVASEKIASMEANLQSLRSLVGGIESQIDTIINPVNIKMSLWRGAPHIAKVKEIEALSNQIDRRSNFLLVYDALRINRWCNWWWICRWKSFTGEKLVGGLNPMNPKAWVTVGSFMGHTNAMIGAVSLVKTSTTLAQVQTDTHLPIG